MMGTFECVYETPCHWCSKWDKKCDRKIDAPTHVKQKEDSCEHEWQTVTFGADTHGSFATYYCNKCGKREIRYD